MDWKTPLYLLVLNNSYLQDFNSSYFNVYYMTGKETFVHLMKYITADMNLPSLVPWHYTLNQKIN